MSTGDLEPPDESRGGGWHRWRTGGPSPLALVVLAIAAIAFVATSPGQPTLRSTFDGETDFDSTGQTKVVPVTVTISGGAVADAETASIGVFSRAAGLAYMIDQVGTNATDTIPRNSMDLEACPPSGDCQLAFDLTLTWNGLPATVRWSVEPQVVLKRGGDWSLEVQAERGPSRLTTLVPLGIGLGILLAILALIAIGAGRRRATSLRWRRLLEVGPAVVLGGLLLLIGAVISLEIVSPRLSVASRFAQIPGPLSIALGAGLLVQGLATVGAIRRRAQDGRVLLASVAGSVVIASVPLMAAAMAEASAYQPVAVVVAITAVVAAGITVLIDTARWIRASANGNDLTSGRLGVLVLQSGVVALAAMLGAAFEYGSLIIPSCVLALAAFGATYVWLRGSRWPLVVVGIGEAILGALGLTVLWMLSSWMSTGSDSVDATERWLAPGSVGGAFLVLLFVAGVMAIAWSKPPRQPYGEAPA